jgi:hypothetical protein
MVTGEQLPLERPKDDNSHRVTMQAFADEAG